jgi:glyoxylase-like metal-dependent hydrolase (beta-lactamase superfamily II)
MPAQPNRRDFIHALMGFAAGVPLLQDTLGIKASKLSDKLAVVSMAGGNVVILEGGDGLLLVNGTLPEQSAGLMSFLADQFKNQHVSILFNTDWHFEHTGSNEAFRKAGAKIIAHENTKLWIGADFYSDWEKRTYKPRPPDALPTDTFYTTGKMVFGEEPIEYGYMAQAHTDGDIYVFLPRQNVLVAGDVLSVGQYPILDYVTGGWIGGLQNANQALLKIATAETRIVPGTGPVQTRDDLQAQADMCNAMRDRLVKLMRQGMGPEDMIAAAPSKEFDAKWGNPELFIKNAYRGMWGHVRELGNIV